MSTLGSGALNLLDWAKRLDPDGKVPEIVEILSQSNDIVKDMPFMEGNLPTGHRTTVRSALPTVYWRLLNQGVSPSKSTTAQIEEACGIMEAWSEVDKDLALLNGNTAEFRLSEAVAFIEAMSQEFASTLFYGNAGTAPEEFNGLSSRYNSLSGNIAAQVITGGAAGGQTDLSSIWLIGWGGSTIHGIFPKGSKVGLQHEDLGEVTVETTAGVAGQRMRAFQDHFQWKVGVAVKDYRFAVRIPNIDISNLVSKSTAADVIELMIKAIHRIPAIGVVKPVFYMNRSVFQMLDIQRRDDVISGGGLVYQNVDGMVQYSFRGIPVKVCDALNESETAVS